MIAPFPRLLLTALLALPASAAPAPSSAAEVKAVFLLNFTKFVDWPPDSFPNPRSPVVIGVLGADPFGPTLDQTVAGETVDGRPIEIKRFKTLGDLAPCHILFISSSHERSLPDILRRLRTAGILTVSDMDGFAARGGAIQFRAEGRRMRFEISRDAVDEAGLKMSARLLNLASVVHPRRP